MLSTALSLLVSPALALVPASTEAIDFERQVWPILEARCVECHRATHVDERGRTRRPKGGLRLDGKGWILRGTGGGPVLVAGAPEDSLFYELITLGADDPDLMPADEEPLKAEEIEILERWIEEGLAFGAWVGAPGPDLPKVESDDALDQVSPRLKNLARLADGLAAADERVVRKAAGDEGRIEPALLGSPLLRVAYVSRESEVDDGVVERLASVRSHVTHLALGGTRITDDALSLIGRMPRLTVLDLHGTAITDRGLARLGELEELRSLNLYGTAVTDAGLTELEELSTLTELFLRDTAVTDAGAARLSAALPSLRIHLRVDLPGDV